MPTPAPPIDAAPAIPLRSDRSTFSARFEAFMTWQSVAYPQVVTTVGTSYTNAAEAAASAVTAAASAATAVTARDQAIAASGAILWVSSAVSPFANFAVGDVRRSPAQLARVYACRVAGLRTLDPSTDPTNWQLLSTDLLRVAVAGTTYSAAVGELVELQNVAASTVTAPASPAAGDAFGVSWVNNLTSNVVNWNGLKQEGLSDATTTLDSRANGYVEFYYTGATYGWKVKTA